MFNDFTYSDFKDKDEIINIINSNDFKKLFIENNISNVIIFGSLYNGDFTEESDVDIAIIAEKSFPFDKELILTQKLEEMISREIDFIDINDDSVNNLIKISALNSKFIILENELLEEKRLFYDNLARENEEFWRILDREVLGIE